MKYWRTFTNILILDTYEDILSLSKQQEYYHLISTKTIKTPPPPSIDIDLSVFQLPEKPVLSMKDNTFIELFDVEEPSIPELSFTDDDDEN